LTFRKLRYGNEPNLVRAGPSVLDLDAGEIDPVVVRHYDYDKVLVLFVVDGWVLDCFGRKTLRLIRRARALNARHGDR
jgi:hypothetical protein